MRSQANSLFPFAIAVVLPPAGLILGLVALNEGDRDTGVRIIAVAVLAALVWGVLLAG